MFWEGIGQMNTFTAHLHLKPDSHPRFLKARPAPFALREPIEKKLEQLDSLGIVQKVTHNKQAALILPVPKPDGSLRVCGDYKTTINQYIDVDQYPLPNLMTCLRHWLADNNSPRWTWQVLINSWC